MLAWVGVHRRSAAVNALIGLIPSERQRTVRELCGMTGLLLLAIGFWTINRTSPFPGALALFPTTAAVLLIFAGPASFVNRAILSNRVAVWIGLISFPLYLWHWPLLSFAHILNGDVPNPTIRIGAVVISVGLAWATYVLLERRIRTDMYPNAKAAVLAALMIAVGVIGYYAYSNDGLATRQAVKSIASQNSGLKFAYDTSSGWICDQFKGTYCAYRGKPPFAVVIGDSHAPRIYAALKDRYLAKSEGIANIGSDACPALIDVLSINDPPGIDPNCIANMSAAIRRVAADPSITTVYLLNRGPLYTTGKGFGEVENMFSWVLTSKDRPKEKSRNAAVFAEALDKTIQLLLASQKDVTYFIDAPELGFDIKRCVQNRPLTLGRKEFCGVKTEDYMRRTTEYKRLVHSVLDRYPSVKVMDLSVPLCDDQYCRGEINGTLMYTDDDHLSLKGAQYVIDKLKSQL